MNTQLILTCEHGVDSIPEAWQACFTNWQELLNSHRGIDFGAQAISRYLQNQLQVPLFEAHASRLLIDCNRSLDHAQCFSEATMELPLTEKQAIIDQFYTPYRQTVFEAMRKIIQARQQVLHLSIHSFTPIMAGQIRTAEIGLLYDPKPPRGKSFAPQRPKLLLPQ